MKRFNVTLLAAGLLAAFASAGPVESLQALHQQVPNAILSSALAGHTDPSSTVHFTVSLTLSDPDGLQRFADSVSNPKSPNFRQFITPEEVGMRFGPSMSQVNAVVSYLQSKGVTIDLVSRNRMGVLAHGSAAQAEAVFHTTLNDYELHDGSAREGEIFRANASPLSVPEDLSRLIQSVSGMETYTKPQRRYLEPNMTRTLYSTAGFYSLGNEGQNRTVAISNFDGFQESNLLTFYSTFSLPTPPNGVESNVTIYTIEGGSQNNPPAGEGDLDIQMVLGVAPLCNLHIYDGDANDPMAVWTQEASDNTADVITESYGWELDSDTLTSAHAQHLSMTSTGITYMAASGDSGTTIEPYDYPDIDPEVLIVGGTSVTTDSSGDRQSEVVWDDGYGAGGGGWSTNTASFNTLPSWQKGEGVPTNINYRLFPDVALDADPNTGLLFFGPYQGQEDVELLGGGTSAASPTCAGSLALTEQYLISQGALTANAKGNYRLGRIQDTLYTIGETNGVFYDVTSGTNGTLPNGTTSNAGVGWDFASGWGAPNFANLATYLEGSLTAPPAVSKIAFSPTSVEGGSSAASTGTVTLASTPSAAVTVTLKSGNTIVKVPASITIPAGSITGTFSATTTASVGKTASILITATADGTSASTDFGVTAPKPASLGLSPASVPGGASSTGTVTLDQVAPTGGVVVTLSSNNTAAATPAVSSVTVAAGAKTATFSVTTKVVSSTTAVTISAASGGATATATLTDTAPGPVLNGLTLSPSTVTGGTSSTGKVTLTGAAPTGGTVVSLTSSSTYATLPTSVTVAAGATSATFTVSTKTYAGTYMATITAKQGGVTETAALTVTPAVLNGLTLNPSSVVGGNSSTGTVTLLYPAPTGGLLVSLTSSSTFATLPSTVTVAAGAKSATFTISTNTYTGTYKPTITAKEGGVTETAVLTVTPH